jgi:DNA-binding LacI/PurR family transcriptional regulator
MRKITIQDISKVAGTSPSTVSRVLTGSAIVSPEKRDAVQDAIRKLNYRPSHIARSLKTRVTYSVGLLLNDITNPYYSAIARGVEDEAHRQGYSLILCNTSEDPERERLYLEVLQDKHVDGVILGSTDASPDRLLEISLRMPIIQVDRVLSEIKSDAVVVDNFKGSYEAARFLIARGHREIGIVRWRRSISTLAEREAGVRQALADAGISPDALALVEAEGLTSSASRVAVLDHLYSPQRPTALIALNNQLGLGVLAACQQVGVRIPNDLALIVFDDLDLFSFFQPPITVVEQPTYQIGERAMQLLLARLDADESLPYEKVVLPTRLIVRQSA